MKHNFFFDIDGVICKVRSDNDYKKSKPIKKINLR